MQRVSVQSVCWEEASVVRRRAPLSDINDSTRGVQSTAFSGNRSKRIVLQLMLNLQLFRHASSFPRKENTGPATFLFSVPLPPSPRCFLPFKENPVAFTSFFFYMEVHKIPRTRSKQIANDKAGRGTFILP